MQFKSVQYKGLEDGPRLIITGAVHGNETCGTKGILRVLDELERGDFEIKAGTVTFVPVTNPLAYAKGVRAGDRNLNRNLCPTTEPKEFEDHVANWICPLLASHDVLLDLHSFNAQSEPFVMVGPRNNNGKLQPFAHAEKERAMARILGVKRYVDGWLAAYSAGVERRMQTRDASEREQVVRYGIGTTEYMRSQGGYALTLECGQHAAPEAPHVAYRAIKNVLAHLGLIDAPAPQPMALEQMETLSMVVVHDRAAEGDRFIKVWSSFDAVKQGDTIGTRADGTPVLADFDGRILFPDVNAKPGHEWFYLAKPHREFERYAD